MRKILQMITLSEYGGASRVLTSLINTLPQEEYEITLLTGEGSQLRNWLRHDVLKRMRHVQLKSMVRAINPFKDLVAIYQLYRFMKQEKFDIVHCHSSKAGVLGRIAARLAGIPQIFFTVHGWVMDDSQPWWLRQIYTWSERLAALCCTKIICVSLADQRKALYYSIAKSEKFVVIHNGVSIESDISTDLRQEFALDNKFIVLMVARLAPPKLPLLFFETAKHLQEYKDMVFVVVGGGKEYDACKAFIDENNLENVLLLGERENAGNLFSEADVGVLLSTHEGLPMVILEAMFSAKTVIASNVGGIPELISDGQTGFLVENSVEIFSSKLLELYQDRQKCEAMGQKALTLANKEFTVQHMTSNYLTIYNY